VRSRQPPPTRASAIETDADLLNAFLSDAAHVPGGHADGVTFPRSGGEAAAIVAQAGRVLPIGAQSSLTGGATPRGGILLSTRALTLLDPPANGMVRVGAGVPLKTLQTHLATFGQYYPPVPTYDGAFVGGTIATNAAGAATFKYGSTRRWVAALTVVLADGTLLDIERGEAVASVDGWFEMENASGILRVPIPSVEMPRLPKISAGYFSQAGMDLVDLFIGSEGTLGVIVEATLRVIPRPRILLVLIACDGDAAALRITAALRREAQRAWNQGGSLDVAAVEYIDPPSLAVLPGETFARAQVARPAAASGLLLIQVEIDHDVEPAVEALQHVLDAEQVDADPVVALPDDPSGAARLFALREAVPAAVNARIGAAQLHDAAVQKTAGDMIVPFDRLGEWLARCRDEFARRGLEYAIWGHISDGNLHPNVIPASADQAESGRDALREIARTAMAMGGAPLAEHGVGRNPLKQELLRMMYGDAGIERMRATKRALDPTWKLAPGVLFPPDGS
jgi:D-lactate dehydrogenase (cytochrome)